MRIEENEPKDETTLPRVVSEEELAALPPRARQLVRAHLRAAGVRIASRPVARAG